MDRSAISVVYGDESLNSTPIFQDNIGNVKSWCSRKFNMDPAALDKQFGISADLDYVE